MNIKSQFQYDFQVSVSSSQIGIGKWSWITTKSESEISAKRKMKKHRFDVLPIVKKDGTVTHYFSTQKWNDYSSLNKNEIDSTRAIYYRTSLRDLVRKFIEDGRHFYFLTDNKEILGLVSYVNLNCQLVYNYLFIILSDIERKLADLLRAHIEESKLIEQFKNSDDTHLNHIASEYQKSISSNNDTDVFQHMYLQTLGICLKKNIKQLPVKYKGLNKFQKKFGAGNIYSNLRNKIMHPVRPILSDKESIKQIDELLTDYEEMQEIWSIK